MKKLEIGDFLYTWSEYNGNTIYQVVNVDKKCQCGANDKITLQIVCNNNFGYDGTLDQFFPYNEKKGFIMFDCEKNIEKAIIKNKMKLFNKKQAVILRQQLLDNQWN